MPPGGGTDYDRDLISVDYSSTNNSNTSSTYYSTTSQNIFVEKKKIHKSCDPKQYADEKIVCYHANPIVFALDVTGSMGDWAKVIYDKLPSIKKI
jgi:hypothetical protein